MYTELKYTNELYHHGIKGQKWGVRRFQNSDGSYTSAGRSRYGIQSRGVTSNKNSEDMIGYKYNKPGESGWKGAARAVKAKYNGLSDNQKKAIKIGAAVAGTALAAYATYKIASPIVKNMAYKKRIYRIANNVLNGKRAGYNFTQHNTYKQITKFRSSNRVRPMTSTNIRNKKHLQFDRITTKGTKVPTNQYRWLYGQHGIKVNRPRSVSSSSYRQYANNLQSKYGYSTKKARDMADYMVNDYLPLTRRR